MTETLFNSHNIVILASASKFALIPERDVQISIVWGCPNFHFFQWSWYHWWQVFRASVICFLLSLVAGLSRFCHILSSVSVDGQLDAGISGLSGGCCFAILLAGFLGSYDLLSELDLGFGYPQV